MRKVAPKKWELVFSVLNTFMILKSHYCDPDKCIYRCTRQQKAKCHDYYQRLANGIEGLVSEDTTGDSPHR